MVRDEDCNAYLHACVIDTVSKVPISNLKRRCSIVDQACADHVVSRNYSLSTLLSDLSSEQVLVETQTCQSFQERTRREIAQRAFSCVPSSKGIVHLAPVNLSILSNSCSTCISLRSNWARDWAMANPIWGRMPRPLLPRRKKNCTNPLHPYYAGCTDE